MTKGDINDYGFGNVLEPRKCVDCGAEFQAQKRSRRQVRCKECQKERLRGKSSRRNAVNKMLGWKYDKRIGGGDE